MPTVRRFGKSLFEIVIFHTDRTAGVVTGHGFWKPDVYRMWLRDQPFPLNAALGVANLAISGALGHCTQ